MVRQHLLATLALGAVACAGDIGGGEPVGGHGGTSTNGLSVNKLSLNKLSLNKLSLNKLSLNGLSEDGFAGLAESADGREVLTYVARCALPDDDALIAEVDGVRYEFPGRLGLAPEWQEGACERSCQRWVSACLLAHGNGLGVEVPISLRGHHPALATTDDERRDYPVQEAAFYGNLFDPIWNVDYPMYICSGDDMAQLFNDPHTWLKQRLCGIWNECPIASAGSCREPLGDQQAACEQHEGGLHTRCMTADGITMIDPGRDPLAEPTGDPPTADEFVFDEVITVYLQR